MYEVRGSWDGTTHVLTVYSSAEGLPGSPAAMPRCSGIFFRGERTEQLPPLLPVLRANPATRDPATLPERTST